ncbi:MULTISPECIES: family 16 glycoside hydrolase [unclassified Dysgonomonas]|jgi:hypothetical protein|uniref:DUF1080 domain-containing protein n=1 Tax=unclassified Dysgonomonas TaxID=2630389 RepID=UPI0025BDBD84|nr:MULTISPECIES: family 16 glycoside hydrolase [unclassified Dysgonomonas]MDR2004701.1 DUF1080 domain-containing protein [Prevotella sp.]HMM01852.1 DUF1080 domain-containing protein [Dysgonomonas sp.]
MSRIIILLLVLSFIWLNSCTDSKSRILFNGNGNKDWQTVGNVSINDSILILSGPNSRATLKNGKYKDFDLKLVLRTTQNGKGFICFHTDDSGKGYRIAINNDATDPIWWRMTGSLLSVRNLTKSLVKDNQWFTMNIRVEGQSIVVKVNGEPVVEYIEPADPLRISPNDKCILSSGTISVAGKGDGAIELKNISIETLDRKDINIPAQLTIAKDEQNDDILHLHQEDFPVLDYHVHLKGGFTKEAAAKQSRKTGINYAVAPNCGIGFPVTNDKDAFNFLDTMHTQPFILAMQGEGREWVTTFSEKARHGFDFVFTDALTFNDLRGRRVHLWVNEEVVINDEQQYMDMIVDRICSVLQEPADVYVNPFFLPEQMNDRYDAFWTEDRINKVIDALAKSGMALEINELYNIPNKTIIMKAKRAGVKFTFGSNNISPEVGRLEYSIRMKKECNLMQLDMYKPKVKL